MSENSKNDLPSSYKPKNDPVTFTIIHNTGTETGIETVDMYSTVADTMKDEELSAEEICGKLAHLVGGNITVEDIEKILEGNDGTRNGRYYFDECSNGRWKCISKIKLAE